MDIQFLIGFLNIIVIDLVLSGDNAVVVGMASRNLPPKERKQAILWGTVGAVGLRVLFTGIATWLLDIPYIKILGGALLVWIALKLLTQEEEATKVKEGHTKWEAVKIIIIADFIMSLDNVLAIGGAANGNMFLVLFGLLLSVPLLMWGSAMVAKWMNEYPVLTYFGSGVLAFTAGTMMLEDPFAYGMLMYINLPYMDTVLPVLLTVIIILVGRVWRSAVFTIHHVK